jgi:transposase InsO family protein
VPRAALHRARQAAAERLRDEYLNEALFSSLSQALLSSWQEDYNTTRPRSALANSTPQEFRNQYIALAVNLGNGQNFNPGLH